MVGHRWLPELGGWQGRAVPQPQPGAGQPGTPETAPEHLEPSWGWVEDGMGLQPWLGVPQAASGRVEILPAGYRSKPKVQQHQAFQPSQL